jgi:hypothetical protein
MRTNHLGQVIKGCALTNEPVTIAVTIPAHAITTMHKQKTCVVSSMSRHSRCAENLCL